MNISFPVDVPCYAVCRNTPDGNVEDADICYNITDAYISLKYYRKRGYVVWLEPRHLQACLSGRKLLPPLPSDY